MLVWPVGSSINALPVLVLLFYSTSADSVAERKLEKSANCLSVTLYKEVVCDRNNFVTSPYSVSLLLSMILMGAGGRTHEEIVQALHYKDISMLDIQEAFKCKMEAMKYSGPNTLRTVSSVWLQKSYTISRKFRNLAMHKFHTDVFKVDFEGRPNEAAIKINSWVKRETQGFIPTFLHENLHTDTAMVLASAMYFKGLWAKRFDRHATRRGTFHNRGSEADTSQVLMMTQQSTFNYKYDPGINAEVLEMKYSGGNLSLVILFPESHLKFEDFEQALTCEKFEEATKLLLPTTVDITFPVFEVSSRSDLKAPLGMIGIQRLFDLSANLSGIGKNLFVTDFVQSTFFSVSEEGSEAASATVVVAGKRTASHPPEFVCMKLDRPFLFLVWHKVANLVLFLGRIVELPSS